MRMHLIASIATGVGLLAVDGHADEHRPVRLRLEVEAACTDGDDFGRRLRSRSPRLDVGADDDATKVAVTIPAASPGERLEGTMQVGDSIRRVEGGTCEEIADALSLVTALMFDPEAGTASPPPPPVTTPAASETAPPARAAIESPVLPPPALEDDKRWAIGMHGVGAAIDEVPIGASVFGEMTLGRDLSTLTLRLALTTYSASVELGPRAANMVWSFLAPQVCPLRVRAGPLSVFPCAGVAVGVISSEPTRGAARARSLTRAWFAPRGAVRARVGVAARLGVEVEAGLDVPRIRDRYSFGDAEAYRIPAVVPSLGVGIAMELP